MTALRGAVVLAGEIATQLHCWLAMLRAAVRIAVHRGRLRFHGDAGSAVVERRLIVISFYSPPYRSIYGTQRVGKFIKFLGRLGWKITLVTSQPAPEDVDAGLEGISPGVEVIRLDPRVFVSPSLAGNSLAVPDRYVPWGLAAADAVKSVVARQGPAIVLATAPPYSNAIAATLAAGTLRLPFVADFRDPWSKIDFYWTIRNSVLRGINRLLERGVLWSASRVLTVVYPRFMHDYLDFPGARAAGKVQTILNGYDEEDFEGLAPSADLLLGNKFVISYVGSIYDAETLRLITQPIRKWHARHPDELSAVLFVYAGANGGEVTGARLPCATDVRGYLSHREAIRLRMSSHLQLLALPAGFNRHIMTGKIFEILRCGAPVLARADRSGGVAELIGRTAGGFVVPQDDDDAAVEILRRQFKAWQSGERAPARDADGIAHLSRERQAKDLSEILDQLVVSRP